MVGILFGKGGERDGLRGEGVIRGMNMGRMGGMGKKGDGEIVEGGLGCVEVWLRNRGGVWFMGRNVDEIEGDVGLVGLFGGSVNDIGE